MLSLRERVKEALKKALAIIRLEGWNGARRIWKHILHQPLLSRREKALKMVNPNGLGLEIGPESQPHRAKETRI